MAPEEIRAASDGGSYTKAEFLSHYGEERGNKLWESAAPKAAEAVLSAPADLESAWDEYIELMADWDDSLVATGYEEVSQALAQGNVLTVFFADGACDAEADHESPQMKLSALERAGGHGYMVPTDKSIHSELTEYGGAVAVLRGAQARLTKRRRTDSGPSTADTSAATKPADPLPKDLAGSLMLLATPKVVPAKFKMGAPPKFKPPAAPVKAASDQLLPATAKEAPPRILLPSPKAAMSEKEKNWLRRLFPAPKAPPEKTAQSEQDESMQDFDEGKDSNDGKGDDDDEWAALEAFHENEEAAEEADGSDSKADWSDSKADQGDSKADWSDSKADWSDSKADWSDSKADWSDSKADWSDSKADWSDSKADWSDSKADWSDSAPDVWREGVLDETGEMRYAGTIRTFIEERKFGFIISEVVYNLWGYDTFLSLQERRGFFVHSDVTFNVWTNKDGKPQARNLRSADEPIVSKVRSEEAAPAQPKWAAPAVAKWPAAPPLPNGASVMDSMAAMVAAAVPKAPPGSSFGFPSSPPGPPAGLPPSVTPDEAQSNANDQLEAAIEKAEALAIDEAWAQEAPVEEASRAAVEETEEDKKQILRKEAKEAASQMHVEMNRAKLMRELKNDLKKLGTQEALQDKRSIPKFAKQVCEKYLKEIGATYTFQVFADVFHKVKFVGHRKALIFVAHDLLTNDRRFKNLPIHKAIDFAVSLLSDFLLRISDSIASLPPQEHAIYDKILDLWESQEALRKGDLEMLRKEWNR